MPEFTAPGIGRRSTTVTVDVDVNANSDGVLYAVGGAGGGLSVWLDRGTLVFEYNMLLIERTTIRSGSPLAPGRRTIVVDTRIDSPGGAAEVELRVDDAVVASGRVPRTVPAAFTATETFDVGVDLGSPVSTAYADRRPFATDATIHVVEVRNVD
jgi:arylsulfatase